MKTFSNVSSAILFENKTGKNNLAIYFNDMGLRPTDKNNKQQESKNESII